MKRITVELLKAHGACSEEVAQFQELFPKGAPVSMRSFNKAQKAGLTVFWTEILLAGPARAKYQRVTEQAWAEYERVTGPARAKYQRVTEQALVEALKMQEANDDSND